MCDLGVAYILISPGIHALTELTTRPRFLVRAGVTLTKERVSCPSKTNYGLFTGLLTRSCRP